MLKHIKVNPESDASLISQLVEQIRYLIASGELTVGDQLPPIRDLAAQLGIHMHTVRMAYQRLEADGLVSIEGRRGTLVRPSDLQELKGKSGKTPSFTFGVLLPGYNLVFEEMIRGITEVTQQNHWLPNFSFTNNNPVLANRVVSQMVAKQVDGFIVVGTGIEGVLENSIQLAKLPPIVFVDSPDMPGYQVLCDNKEAAFLATQHLVTHGHDQIAMITPPLDWPNVSLCQKGYQKAILANNQKIDTDLILETEDFSPESGYDAAKSLFQRKEVPGAVFAAADALAVGVIRALSELGFSVPGDVALTSFNDSVYARNSAPALTSSSFPAYEMGLKAADMLHKLIRGEDVSKKGIVLPSVLTIRQSCGC